MLEPDLLPDCAHRWIFIAHANVLFQLAARVDLIAHQRFLEAGRFVLGHNMLSTAVKDPDEAPVGHARFILWMVAAIGLVKMCEDLFTTLTYRIYLSTKYFHKKLGQTEFLN